MTPASEAASYFLTHVNHFTLKTPKEDGFYLTELIEKIEPLNSFLQVLAGKRKKTKTIFYRSTFKDILNEEVPDGAYLIPAGLKLTIKSTVDSEVKYKERYITFCRRERVKDLIVYVLHTVQVSSVRLLRSIAESMD
eukprot:IDg18601t1